MQKQVTAFLCLFIISSFLIVVSACTEESEEPDNNEDSTADDDDDDDDDNDNNDDNDQIEDDNNSDDDDDDDISDDDDDDISDDDDDILIDDDDDISDDDDDIQDDDDDFECPLGADLPRGTYVDEATNLMWENPASDEKLIARDAEKYCLDLDLEGYDDWRLPDIDELITLAVGCNSMEDIGYDCSACADGEGPTFGMYWDEGLYGPCNWAYWTTTAIDSGSNVPERWVFHFFKGCIDANYTGDLGRLRCVRAIQP